MAFLKVIKDVIPKFGKSPYWRMILKTKIWVLGTLVTTGMSLLLRPSQLTEQENISVYVNLCVHIYITFLYVTTYNKLHELFSNLIHQHTHHSNHHHHLTDLQTPTVRRKLAPTSTHPFILLFNFSICV